MAGPPDNAATQGFSGITTANGPQASAFSSIMQSFASQNEPDEATPTQPAATVPSQTSEVETATSSSSRLSSASSISSVTSESRTSTVATTSQTSSIPSTLSTSTLSSQSDVSPTSGTPTNSPSSTATNAASNQSDSSVAVSQKCDSISCNSGLQAAIAVPVVLGILAIFGLLFFLARRRKRRQRPASPLDEKAKPKKKWSRHLRVFSFGEELLMGGRFSSTNSLRSGEAGSMRSGQGSRNSGREVSVHSTEEVAPPYRDAISQAQRPVMAGDPTPRPFSTATAPPPYDAAAVAAGRISRATNDRPTTPTSNRSRSDPFRDAGSNPVSPVDGSPFNDPDDENAQSPRPLMSRQSSMLDRLNDNRSEISTLQGSDAGSIREATVARQLSMSGARKVDVTKSNSQRGSSRS